tara:strand:- start:6254 stop:13303 length:7050 start_codon:yes stop_codon:yes gene_type:complete
MKTVDTDYNWWLSGYYDDFNGARAIADDQNPANYRDLDHTISHFGTALGGLARLNPRFKHSMPDRLRTNYLSDDPVATSLQTTFDFHSSSAETKLAHNSGIADWVLRDPTLENNSLYNSKAILQYPISMCANRQKYNGASGDSYISFRNGHDSQGQYHSSIGEMDFSYGHSLVVKHDLPTFASTGVAHNDAGNPVPYIHKGMTRTAANHDTPDKTMSTLSIASVYTGEKVSTTFADKKPNAYFKEVQSPSKMPFLCHNLYLERGDGASSASTTAGTHRIISYDGPLRFKGIGESFHMRLFLHKINPFTFTRLDLKIGYKPATTFNKSTQAFADTQSWITVPITPQNLEFQDELETHKHGAGQTTPAELIDDWMDIEVVPDFVANTWKAYANGNVQNFANGSLNHSGMGDLKFTKGWTLDLVWAHNSGADFVCMTTLIDRVAVALPLSNKFSGESEALPPVTSFNIKYGANTISSAEITILDDANAYTLAPITVGEANSEWRLLMFAKNEDRPLWSGVIEAVNHQQDNRARTLQTTIRARDSLAVLDRVLPIWELGQNAFMSLSNHLSMVVGNTKKINQTTAVSDALLFGIGRLTYRGNGLGFNSYNSQEYTRYSKILDGRCSTGTGSAIQMYINEDENGPNHLEKQWMGWGSDDSYKMMSDIVGIQNISGKRYIYIEHDGVSTKGSTAYRNIDVNERILLTGTLYDGNYVVDQIAYRPRTGKTDLVQFRIVDTNSAANNNLLATITHLGRIGANSGNVLITCSGTHGLAVGETIRPLFENSQNGIETVRIINGNDYVIQAVPSSTTLVIKDLNTVGEGSQTQPAVSVTSSDGTIVSYTAWNGQGDHLPPANPAVLRGYTANTPDAAEYDRVKYRTAHARWMRDLPKSDWFRAQFGIIKPEPKWRSGKGSALQHPFTVAQAATVTNWPNSDGSTAWRGIATDIAAGASSISLDEPGLWWHWITGGSDKNLIIDLIDNQTNDNDFIIATGVTTPSFSSGLSWDKGESRFALSNHGFAIGTIVAHVGFGFDDLDGMHMITSIPTTSSYKTQKIDTFRATRDGFSYLQARAQGTGWSDSISRPNSDPDAISIVYKSSDTFDDGLLSADPTGGIYYGNCQLTGVKGVKRDWKRDNTIINYRDIDESNGYKHLFVLWADMRNDGSADADGGYRKNDFGLTLPTNENYSINLNFADQVDASGNPDTFAELKIGEDADIWAFDSEVEPFTGNAWCALPGGSNEEDYATWLRDWDEKAGAFVVIDVSRFWNLNTMACGGRSGYESGGIAEFSDFETVSYGYPYLIDNYWKEATSSYKNSHDEDLFPHHPNSLFFINDGTETINDTSIGQTEIFVKDNSQFDTSGYGVIMGSIGEDRNTESQAFYFSWTGKSTLLMQGQPRDRLTGCYVTSYEVITDPKNAVDQLKADVANGASGSDVQIQSNEFRTTNVTGAFSKVRVYNTTAALYGMRLILNLEGDIRNPAGNSYFTHDKIRILQNLNLADTWATNASLPCISDFNNVPIQSSNNNDNWGSILDARGQTVMSILNTMKEKDGNGLAGGVKAMSWLMGRDNRLEFRESINSGYALTRDNLMVSQLNTQAGSKITNVRVYYNGNSSFVDYPETIAQDVKWKVLNHADLFNRDEALSLAKQRYLIENTPRISVKAEVARLDGNRMLENGRFGYVSDVFRKNVHLDAKSLSWWGNRNGGHAFCGVQNALDSGCPTSHSGADLTGFAVALQSDESFADARGFQLRTMKASGTFAGAIYTTLQVFTIDASNTRIRIRLNNSTDGDWVDVSGGAGWYQPTCVISGITYTLSVYYDGTTLADDTEVFKIIRADSFTSNGFAYSWYGSNSLSHAIQVAYVDAKTPLVSETSLNEMRMMISVLGGTSYENATFKLHLLDLVFTEEILNGEPPNRTRASTAGHSEVELVGNGLVRIQVPSSYGSNASQGFITFSVNIDYLRELVRKRCGGSVLNSVTTMEGITLGSNADSDSIFPLGMRRHTRMGPSADERTAWYAPRLSIVRDVAYVPATTLTYTDTHIDLSNEELVIKGVTWAQKGRDIEKVHLNLEKIETHYAYNLVSALARPPTERQPPRTAPPPPRPRPPFFPDGGVAGGGLVPASQNMRQFSERDGSPSQSVGVGINQISNNIVKSMRGKAEFSNDIGSSAGQWAVLGSKNSGPASSFDRAVDGLEGSTSPSQGAAIATSDGFSLAGVADPEFGAQGETHSHTINVRVPNDASTGIVGVTGSITYETITNGGVARLETTIECLETGETVVAYKTIPMGSVRTNITLVPPTYLEGADVANNTLKITILRRPGQTLNGVSDAGLYQTVTIHNTELTIRRYNQPTVSQSGAFQPY